MPFGGYQDFAACVRANQDKDNPEAYCGSIKAAVEKRMDFNIAKLDAAEHLVFGWASVSIADGSGELVMDSQGDMIEPAELEKAAYAFAETGGAFNALHQGEDVGRLVESLAVTPQKLEAMGFPAEVAKSMGVRYWVGARLRPDVFDRVQKGELTMFSIEGQAVREDV